MTNDAEQKRTLSFLDYFIALAIFFLILLESLYTIHQIGVSWDEPVYFEYAKAYGRWFKQIGSEGAFSREVLEYVFDIALFTNCSPTLNKILGALTYSAFKDVLGEFWAYRFYAPILFALLMVLIFFRMRASGGWSTALSSVIFIFFMPRFFVEGHIGTTEMPLCFFWFLTSLLFEACFNRRWLAPLAGLAYGLTMSVKLTGFFLPIPLLFWAILYHPRKILIPALCLCLIGPLIFLALQPSMWDAPLSDLWQFIIMSTTRAQTAPIPVYFLGKYYAYSAPWYYAPLMVLITVPVLTLVFFALGFWRMAQARFQEQFSVFSLIHFGFFIVLMSLPTTPTYDGVRLFLPAFIFLGLIAGEGFETMLTWLKKFRLNLLPKLGVMSTLILGIILPLIKVYPYGLEYYNELIGGAKGARRAGLETTYWWTVVNEDTIHYLNQILPKDARLLFWPVRTQMGIFYQRLGLLRRDLKIVDSAEFDYMLMLSRPYWDYEPFFSSLGVSRSQLKIIASQSLEGIPLWVLYKRK